MIEQLHCRMPTGMVMWINPSWAALRADKRSLMEVIIASESGAFARGVGCLEHSLID